MISINIYVPGLYTVLMQRCHEGSKQAGYSMQHYLLKFSRPAYLLVIFAYFVGAMPLFCAQCFASPANAQAQHTAVHEVNTAALPCPAGARLCGIYIKSTVTVNAPEAQNKPVPLIGNAVVLLDSMMSTALPRLLDRPQFFARQSRVIHFGVRLE